MGKVAVIVVVGAALALALLFGVPMKASATTDAPPLVTPLSRGGVVEIIRGAAKKWGVDPDWGVALALTESDLDPNAENISDLGDLIRGGSYGLFGVTLKSAKEWGWDISAAELKDPVQSSEIAMRAVAQLSPGGTLADVGAWWNSGRNSASDPTLPESTRAKYLPRLARNLARVRAGEVA